MWSAGTLATECSHQPGDALGLYREARRELGSHGFYIRNPFWQSETLWAVPGHPGGSTLCHKYGPSPLYGDKVCSLFFILYIPCGLLFPITLAFSVSPPLFLLYDDAPGRAGSHNSASLQIRKRCLSGRHAALWPTWLHFRVERRGGVSLSS